MGIQSISFKSPKPKDRTGNPVNEGCGLPVSRIKTKRSLAWKIEELEGVLETLANVPCSFWMCPGADVPFVHMATCNKCQAMQSLAKVIAALKAEKGAT